MRISKTKKLVLFKDSKLFCFYRIKSVNKFRYVKKHYTIVIILNLSLNRYFYSLSEDL